MKKIDINSLDYIAAGHEDNRKPGVIKKILFTKDDFGKSNHIQMINWACLPVGKSFTSHFHEDMDEVFIILSGRARIRVDGQEEVIKKMDALLIPAKSEHYMENIGKEDVYYVVIGSAGNGNGKTVRTGI
jgi:mannose-6-phosphate isomerase-like protein (cupin superfamily)